MTDAHPMNHDDPANDNLPRLWCGTNLHPVDDDAPAENAPANDELPTCFVARCGRPFATIRELLVTSNYFTPMKPCLLCGECAAEADRLTADGTRLALAVLDERRQPRFD